MKNKIYKFKSSGKSLVELLKKYGIGSNGFYSDWWKNENFAKEKTEPRTYEIELHPEWNNMTYQEQLNKMGKKQEFLPASVLVEFILSHYKKTGERLMKNWYSRTNNVASDEYHSNVGYFDSKGFLVDDCEDDYYSGYLGVSSARSSKSLKPRKIDTLENLDIEIKINNQKYKLVRI